MIQKQTLGGVSDSSSTESDIDLGVGLVDSDKAGQDIAPITGPISAASLDGLFHTGFTAASTVSAAGPIELTESRDDEEEEEGGD